MIRLDVDAFADYCAKLTIPTRDHGLIPFKFWGTQRHLIQEIAAGLELGVHDFTILKGGRQIGGTTTMDALTLWWCQENDGTQGMVVSDEDDNAEYRRDVVLEMQASLPKEWKWPTPVNNRGLVRFYNGSRLSFKSAGTRTNAKLGRSRGLNFLHADEVGAWPDKRAGSALNASLSKENPRRLYCKNSTAQGLYTPFHEMWVTAGKVPTQKQIFIAWWMHELNTLHKPTKASSRLEKDLWGQYATSPTTSDEKAWMREVKTRYGVTITQGQLAWYRWVLEAEMGGEEAMRAQEYSCLPEEAFQAFGEKVIRPELVRAMRSAKKPEPTSYAYEWGHHLGAPGVSEQGPPSPGSMQIIRADADDAPLTVWEEPDPKGVYVISGHPWGSSSPNATEFVAQVWRAWPDLLCQVAEYNGDSAMYQFAWVLMHLVGAYRSAIPPYFIMEVGGAGFRVLEEIQLIQHHGYGLTALPSRQKLQDVLGSIQRYYYHRPDLLSTRSNAIEWRTQATNRPWLIHGLRDACERGTIEVRSESLIDELAALRQGESGDNDEMGAGGRGSDARVITASMAVECWLHAAMPDLEQYVKRKSLEPGAPRHMAEMMVQNMLHGVMR